MAQLLHTEKLKLVNKIAGSEIKVFDNLSFLINEGEWICFVLPHGSGKTSLYKCLISQTLPQGGKVIYNNNSKMDEYDKRKFIKENITSIGELPSIFEGLSVKDWIILQKEIHGIKNFSKNYEKYKQLLLENSIDIERKINSLTLLEIRKSELALTILADTLLIIFDDIEIGLTKEEQEDLMRFVEKIAKGKAVISISSNMLWNKYANKVIR